LRAAVRDAANLVELGSLSAAQSVRAASAPGLGPPLPHLHQDWAHPSRICTGTGPTPPASAPGLGPPRPHLLRVLRCLRTVAVVGRRRRRFAVRVARAVIRRLTRLQVAIINSKKIHVLVDLDGHTSGSRVATEVHRAPIRSPPLPSPSALPCPSSPHPLPTAPQPMQAASTSLTQFHRRRSASAATVSSLRTSPRPCKCGRPLRASPGERPRAIGLSGIGQEGSAVSGIGRKWDRP
jgi:hypothetical protein